MIVHLSLGQEAMPEDLLQSKAVKFAEQRQQAGAKVVSETANIGALHVFCCAMVINAGGLGKLTEMQCRTISIIFLRTATPSRAQDPTRMFREAMELEPKGSGWDDATALSYRLYRNKDATNPLFNRSSARSKFEQQQGEWSSVVRIERPTPARHIPDYFTILGLYVTMTKDRQVLDSAAVSSTTGGIVKSFSPLFLGAPSRAYRDTVLLVPRCSKITLEAMIASKAIAVGSPLKAKHLRHSVMSKIYSWAEGHEDRRPVWERALASARHSQVTFYKSYHLRLDDWSRQAIDSVSSGSKLEDVLLSSAGHSWPSDEGE
jgi:hypothetical protein